MPVRIRPGMVIVSFTHVLMSAIPAPDTTGLSAMAGDFAPGFLRVLADLQKRYDDKYATIICFS